MGMLDTIRLRWLEEDMENTTFINPWGTYFYTVMPFELKNIRATY